MSRAEKRPPGPTVEDEVRAGCAGELPLTGRLEPWMTELCRQPDRLAALLDEHGSPLNLIDPGPIGRNAAELQASASAQGLDLKIYLARKANKTLGVVDEAARLGLGVDLASERELEQALDRGVEGARLVMTAAVKTRSLLELCARSGTTVALDNEDELELVSEVAAAGGGNVRVALRLAPELGPGRTPTRFGLTADRWTGLAPSFSPDLSLAGIQFHLDGYDAGDRVLGIEQAVRLIDRLRALGHRPSFLDIGGGIPIAYLDDSAQWADFQEAHRAALVGEREPITFEGHGLGLAVHGGEVFGRLNVYPAHQRPTRGEWLEEVLSAPLADGQTVAENLRRRALELRCEPGRSLLDGCGMTAARVVFRKQRADGTWLIGLEMNRTQCRSTADEFPVDPLLLLAGNRAVKAGEAIEGFLVGAYCIERELLSWRRMRFPRGVGVGDIVVFPNTGGYMMHILESASHQIALAKNVIADRGSFTVDRIDLAAR